MRRISLLAVRSCRTSPASPGTRRTGGLRLARRPPLSGGPIVAKARTPTRTGSESGRGQFRPAKSGPVLFPPSAGKHQPPSRSNRYAYPSPHRGGCRAFDLGRMGGPFQTRPDTLGRPSRDRQEGAWERPVNPTAQLGRFEPSVELFVKLLCAEPLGKLHVGRVRHTAFTPEDTRSPSSVSLAHGSSWSTAKALLW